MFEGRLPSFCPCFDTLPPNAKDIEFLRAFPKLQRLGTQDAKAGGGLPGQPVAEFWKEYDAKKNAT